MIKRMMYAAILTMLALSGCDPEKTQQSQQQGGTTMDLKVTSPAFSHEGMIPSKYTADGANVSPPLAWENVPQGTKSFALVSDDPDAPMGTWVHWLVWNIPPAQTELAENVRPEPALSNGAVQGTTSFKRVGYGGPAPPSGTHRYYFKIYALDTKLDLKSNAVKSDLEKAMQGHILAQGQLMGRYSRNR